MWKEVNGLILKVDNGMVHLFVDLSAVDISQWAIIARLAIN